MGSEEAIAAAALLDRNDPTRLTSKEIRDGYGSCLQFFICHGLKPWNPDDCVEALAISRVFKAHPPEEEDAENER
jgi:hypothetical protein